MADKCIGKLTLDISDVDKKITKVNEFLNKIGANVDLESKLSSKISAALNKLVNEAQKAGEEAGRALERGVGNGKAEQKLAGLESNMSRLMSEVKTFGREADQTGQTIEKLTGTIQTGFDAAGNKIKEFVNAEGEITKRTEEVRNAVEDQIDAMWKLHDAEEAAYQKQGEAAVKAGLKREEAAAKAAQKEEELAQKQITTMEDTLAKRHAAQDAALDKEISKKEAAIEKEISDYEQAEERKRQASIDAEFAREEARKKSLQVEEEAIAKEIAMMDEAIAKKEQEFQSGKITEAEQAYKRLTNAISQYQIAKKAGNQEQMDYWQREMNAAMSTLSSLEKLLPELKLEESARERIIQLINAAKTQQDGLEKGVIGTSQATGELESQVKGLLTRYLSLMAVIRAISSLVRNMTEYVSEYSDKMNEIQMITLKTDAEVEQLAETYRNLAKDMSVSSLDMADAAIYFTRQGLEAEEIEKRLKNVTMYAKAANVEFEDASEIITAVVNSMGLMDEELDDGRNAAQRVADVFLNIGDNAATSGQEIGEAMQKAAASAGAFGVSMEWLASYIATVSETTRQEARTIGTAFNTIIARLHQIKSTGYNQEDETKVNDIAKALSKIDVVLMDQEGEWRDMEDILVDVASKWDGLDDKTKSYIATTMAGVKQQNVFLALMNDMAKGAENGSRAFELHSIAMNSDGVAAEKYSVYLDSVTAAQERLTIAQEEFYSILDEDVVKEWYNSLADVVEFITDATDSINGLNIILPVAIGLFTSLAIAITKAGGAIAFLTAHPIIAGIAALAAAFVLLTDVSDIFLGNTKRMEKAFNDATEAIAKSNEKIEEYKTLQTGMSDMFAEYGDSAEKLEKKLKATSENQEEYNKLLEDLASVSPIAKQVVEQLKGGFIDQKEAASLLNQELERLIQNEETLSMHNLLSRYANYQSNEKNTRDVAILARGWEEGNYSDIEDPEKRFRNILATTYGTGNLSKELTERIKQAISDYIDSGMSVDDAWDMLATDILYEMFDSFEVPEDMTKRLAEEVMQEVDYVMGVVGKDLDTASYAAIRESLISALFGDDGQLDTKEYANFSKVIAQWVRDIARNGPDSILAELSDVNIAESLAKTLFDPAYFGDLFKSKGEEFSRDFIDAYNKFIKEGFSSDEIATILTGMSQEAWDSAARVYKEQLERAIKEELGIDFLGANSYDENGNVIGTASLMWDDLSLKTLETIHEMVLNGSVDLNTINGLMIKADGDAQKFAESLKNYAKEVGFFIEEVDDWVEPPKGFTDLIKDAKSGIKDIQAIDAAIKDIQENGDDFNYGDMFELAETHKELLTVIDDNGKLLEMLQKIREEASTKQRESFRSAILGTSGSEYGDFATLEDYRKTLTGEDLVAFDAEVEALVDKWQKANENAKQVEKELEEEAKQAKNALEEAQKAFKENLSEVETLDKVIAKLQDNKKIDYSDIINLAEAHPEILNFVDDIDNELIPALERIKEQTKGKTKDDIKNIMMESEDYFKGTKYYDPESGITKMRDYITSLHESRGDWHAVAQEVDKAAQDFVDAAEASSTAADTWLDAQMKIAEVQDEVNWAKANNFEDQIRQLQAANEAGGIQDAIALFDSWDKEMQQAVGTEYPAFILQMVKARKAMADQGKETTDLTQQTEALSAAINNAQKLNEVKHFTDTASAIKKLSDGTISAADAYDVLTKDLNKVTKAYEDVLSVQAKQSYNEQEKDVTKHQSITETDVTNLASLLGMTTDQILADFPGAVSMFDELIGKTGELQDVINMLNDTAFIRITGTSDADFSAIQAGLISVENLAEEAIQKLKETGQWEVVPLEMNQTAALWNWDNQEKTAGHWSYDYTTVGAQVLKPTGKNPLFTGSSSVKGKTPTNTKSRGGGGGGSSKDKNDSFRDTNTTTEVEKMLDLMSQVNAIQQYQQSYYQSQNKYYSTTGQLQGVIAYMQKEKEVLEGQNGTLESNIRRIEEYMNAKQAELASLSTEDEKYKEVADDFDKLQKAHQTYTKQLIDNKSAVEALNQAMEEQRKKIRQMEIDLRNLILGAIEDREKKRTDMLNAEIEMENTIYDLIVKRYEKERDEIIRTTDLKIDALNSERDLLEENLRIRKEEAEQEDKAAKLRELEVKYQRIIADPTRAKEAQQLKTEIDSLRKEMAWDLAEEEVKSQQDSIDQQIESLEDYKEYIENYYEDLFEHPQQLIAEMRDIMMGTQEEIINWLKQNDEAYRESSENTQLAMVTGWEETYNEMKGILKTYWDEVEEIIAQGDDYIIEFLKNNSADYAAAGKLQAEAYVDEWKKQLDDLHKAHQTVSAEIAGSYATIQQYNGSGSSSSSSNGGSSKVGGTSKTTATTANMTANAGGSHYYEFAAFGKNYSADKNSSGQYFANRGEAYSAAEQKIDALYQSQKATLDKNGANAYGYNQLAQAYKTAKNSIRAYKTGGIADYTGPAWVDGSPQDPERILTPYQNKLFESFVKTLEKMATISIPSMPNFGALETTGANPVSVGDIIVNVDNLDTDDDYEEMADRVCEILTERIGRTAVVGGLRIRST